MENQVYDPEEEYAEFRAKILAQFSDEDIISEFFERIHENNIPLKTILNKYFKNTGYCDNFRLVAQITDKLSME